MPSRPARSLLAAIAATAIAATGCSSDPAAPAPRASIDTRELTAADKANHLLFTARADRGRLTMEADGHGVLVLDDVAAMTWFSDRPVHDAGTTTPADALRALGWDGNGTAIGDEAPNAALIATELGGSTAIVELVNATIDGSQIRFDIDVIGDEVPEAGSLRAIELFIDDTIPDWASAEGTPTGLARNADGIILGSSAEDLPTPPLTLAPTIADTLDEDVARNQLFAVISGPGTYTSAGEIDLPASSSTAAGGPAWRFTLDSAATGDAAPIVVIKYQNRSLASLATDLSAWASASTLSSDPEAASERLTTILATVASLAAEDSAYAELNEKLTDPSWNGIVIFDASVVVPDQVQDESTGTLASTTIPALALAFTTWPNGPAGSTSASGPGGGGPSFALIDHPAATAGQSPRPGPSLRASFTDGQMESFELDLG